MDRERAYSLAPKVLKQFVRLLAITMVLYRVTAATAHDTAAVLTTDEPSCKASNLRYQVTPAENVKILHLIRHGEGIHNEAKRERGRDAYNDPAFLDARLTETGHSQAASRREELVRASILDDIELVVTSPMMRTIETATAIFGNNATSMIAVEEVRERFGTHPCDQRSSVTKLKARFSHVDFTPVKTDEDTWHTSERESLDNLHSRARRFLEWLEGRPERTIAVVSHHDFLVNFLQYLDAPARLQGRIENCEMRSIALVIDPTHQEPHGAQ